MYIAYSSVCLKERHFGFFQTLHLLPCLSTTIIHRELLLLAWKVKSNLIQVYMRPVWRPAAPVPRVPGSFNPQLFLSSDTRTHTHCMCTINAHTRQSPRAQSRNWLSVCVMCGCNTDLLNLGCCTAAKKKNKKWRTSPSNRRRHEVKRRALITHHALPLPPFLSLSLLSQGSKRICVTAIFPAQLTTRPSYTFFLFWKVHSKWCRAGVDQSVKLLYLTSRMCVFSDKTCSTQLMLLFINETLYMIQ